MDESSARVSEWLRGNEDASEVGSILGAESVYGGDFDEEKYVLRKEEERVVKANPEDSRLVQEVLGDVARAAQRKTVCGFHKHYSRGRMLDVPRYGKEVMLPQKFFRLEAFMELSSLDDPVLYDALSKGVLRTRLGAKTGMGKTRKLPGMIASKCGLRVCQVELDTVVSKSALKFQKKQYTLPGGVSSWSRQKKAFLATMSYSEFRGIVLSGNRDRLFSDFDVFYFDEAHEPLAAVWAARLYFATYAQSHNSLLVASATVSTVEGNNTTANNVGMFVSEPEQLSLVSAIESGLLLTKHLRDRALLLVASDEDVALARAYYVENGVEVRIMDSASGDADYEAVCSAFSVATAVVPRVLIATQEHGTSYNFPVTYVISTCTRRVYEMNETHALVEKEVPLMQKTRVQHQGRVGRGLATGGGGWLLTSDVAMDKELLTGEALEAYLSLVAAGITPRPGLFDVVTKVLPKGIDSGVARSILRVGLPPALTVRYLGSDGLFASAFVSGVKLFTQSGENLRPSKDVYPLGYDRWITETVGGYYIGDESQTRLGLQLPFASPAGLKVAMHTISAVAEGLLQLEYWDWFDEEEESDNEEVGVRVKVVRKVRPRLPQAPEVTVTGTSASSEVPFWAYTADPADAVKRVRRHAMSWDANGEGKTAVQSLLRALEDATLGKSVAAPEVDVPEHGGQVAYALPIEDHPSIPVVSPGGGKIMLVARSVHAAFMAGSSLSATEAVGVVQHLVAIRAVQRFVKSTVFDNWSPAWLCWFGTFGEVQIVEAWKEAGLHSDAIKLLGYLYDRFRGEVVSVALSSNLYKDRLGSFFRTRPSVTKMVTAARKGRLPVAQSDTFVSRVMTIKDKYDLAVLAIEDAGVFAPGQVSGAQRRLPFRDKGRGLRVIDEEVVAARRFEMSDGVSGDWRH